MTMNVDLKFSPVQLPAGQWEFKASPQDIKDGFQSLFKKLLEIETHRFGVCKVTLPAALCSDSDIDSLESLLQSDNAQLTITKQSLKVTTNGQIYVCKVESADFNNWNNHRLRNLDQRSHDDQRRFDELLSLLGTQNSAYQARLDRECILKDGWKLEEFGRVTSVVRQLAEKFGIVNLINSQIHVNSLGSFRPLGQGTLGLGKFYYHLEGSSQKFLVIPPQFNSNLTALLDPSPVKCPKWFQHDKYLATSTVMPPGIKVIEIDLEPGQVLIIFPGTYSQEISTGTNMIQVGFWSDDLLYPKIAMAFAGDQCTCKWNEQRKNFDKLTLSKSLKPFAAQQNDDGIAALEPLLRPIDYTCLANIQQDEADSFVRALHNIHFCPCHQSKSKKKQNLPVHCSSFRMLCNLSWHHFKDGIDNFVSSQNPQHDNEAENLCHSQKLSSDLNLCGQYWRFNMEEMLIHQIGGKPVSLKRDFLSTGTKLGNAVFGRHRNTISNTISTWLSRVYGPIEDSRLYMVTYKQQPTKHVALPPSPYAVSSRQLFQEMTIDSVGDCSSQTYSAEAGPSFFDEQIVEPLEKKRCTRSLFSYAENECSSESDCDQAVSVQTFPSIPDN